MILCSGEALIDMIPLTSGDGSHGFAPLAGGSVFNTAIALGRLGQRVGYFSGLSSDLFGRKLRAELKQSNVDYSLAITSDRPTTLAFVELTDGHASYTFYDENTAGRMITADQLPVIPARVSTMFFGGISLISEPCADTYAALMVRESGARVIVLDPNIRAGFIDDEARFRTRLNAMLAQADIVKVSDEDLHWNFPDPAPLNAKAAKLKALGPGIVILTRGAEGASAFYGKEQVIDVASPTVKVVDTVGAGDTFNAGVMAKLSEQGLLSKQALADIDARSMSEALSFGAQAAAITVSRKGANPPWSHEIPEVKL